MADIFVAAKEDNKNKTIKENAKSNMNAFSSFCQNPKGVSFQAQQSNESIILFLRAHFITNISWILTTLLLIIIPIFILILLPFININFLSSLTSFKFTLVYLILYYLIVFSYFFVSFLHWFYNIFIVSSQRVIDIDYSDIVVHDIAMTKLTHVQDVNYTQTGFIPTFFNYGHLFVQTAGSERNFEADNVPKPREATDIISELIGKVKHGN